MIEGLIMTASQNADTKEPVMKGMSRNIVSLFIDRFRRDTCLSGS
jgi:hypothetical protein